MTLSDYFQFVLILKGWDCLKITGYVRPGGRSQQGGGGRHDWARHQQLPQDHERWTHYFTMYSRFSLCLYASLYLYLFWLWLSATTSFGPCRLLLLWVLGISGCSLLKDLEGWSVTSCCVRHPLLDQINVMCGWNVQQIFAIVKNVKDEFGQLYFMSLLKCIAEFTGGWKENFGKVCVSASLAKSRPTWYISAAIHTHRTTQCAEQQANVFEGLVPFCRYSLTFNTTIICAFVRDVTLQKSSMYSVLWSSRIVFVLWDAAEFCAWA